MKSIIQKFCMTMALLVVSVSTLAYDFEVDGLYYEVNLEKMTATLVAGENMIQGDIIIPSVISYKGREFKVIATNGAFAGNSGLTSVSFPESLSFLGEKTFDGCSSLQSITGLDNVVEIGVSCFAGCESLVSVDLSKNLRLIESDAFNGCVSLSHISLPEGLVSIGRSAFKNCYSITSVLLPSSLSILPSFIFSNCESLQNIELPNSIIQIEEGAFYGCKALTNLEIPFMVASIGDNVFNGCINLTRIKISDSDKMLIVGKKGTASPLFEDCPLDSVYMGRNLTYPKKQTDIGIPQYISPFIGSRLYSMQFGLDVDMLYYHLLKGCNNINELSIPKNIVDINYGVFTGCTSLSKIIFEDGPKVLTFYTGGYNNEAVHYMNECPLRELYIGRNINKNVEGWSSYSVFTRQSGLKNISIGDYVTNISCLLYDNNYSLSEYSNLESLQVGAGLTFVPDLSENSNLIHLSLTSPTPQNAKGFSDGQFMDLDPNIPIGSLSTYTTAPVWKNFWKFYEQENLLTAFESNGIYYRILSENSLEVLKGASEYVADIVIPSFVDYNGLSYSVMSLGGAFNEDTHLTSITIPSSILYLEKECFKNCSKLQSVIFNCMLEEIPSGAFEGCVSLSKIVLPKRVRNLQDMAFKGCTSLEEFICSEDLMSIGTSVFEKCKSLKKFDGKNVLIIGNSAFKDCANIEEIIFDNVLDFPQYCFSGCINLRSVKPLESVLRIEANCFDGCQQLQEVYLPNILSISANAFKGCSELDSILLGENLESIGDCVFSGCTALKTLVIPGKVVSLGKSMFEYCGLKELIFLDSDIPLILPYGSFYGDIGYRWKDVNGKRIWYDISYWNGCFDNLRIEKLYIGRNLSNNSRYMITGDGSEKHMYDITCYDAPFNNLPNLRVLGISKNVDILGPDEVYLDEVDFKVTSGSFKKCESLEIVNVLNPIPPMGAEFSEKAYKNCTLYVPEGSKSAYELADGWKKFSNIVEGNYIPVESFRIEQDTVELPVNGTIQLAVLIEPENATPTNIEWKSSNEKVVVVSESGLISGVSEGSATVTAILGDFSATCEVTVYIPIIEAEQVVLTIDKAELNIGEAVQLEATVLPDDTTDKTLEWKSSNEEVAIVDESGLVTAIGEGSATISVTCGEASAQCEVTVIEENGVENIFANPNSSISIYSTDGIIIKKDAKVEDLKTLVKGIYIIVSGENRYKVSI